MSSLNSDACVQIRGKHAEYSSDVPPLHPIALLDVSNAILELEKLAESVCADPVNATTQDVHWDTITVDGVCVCVGSLFDNGSMCQSVFQKPAILFILIPLNFLAWLCSVMLCMLILKALPFTIPVSSTHYIPMKMFWFCL
jgi:hypothetical protein